MFSICDTFGEWIHIFFQAVVRVVYDLALAIKPSMLSQIYDNFIQEDQAND